MQMKMKMLPLTLPLDVYKRLDEAGRMEERNVLQQARWFITRAVTPPVEASIADRPAATAKHREETGAKAG